MRIPVSYSAVICEDCLICIYVNLGPQGGELQSKHLGINPAWDKHRWFNQFAYGQLEQGSKLVGLWGRIPIGKLVTGRELPIYRV